MSDDQKEKSVFTNPVRLFPVFIGLFLIIRAIIKYPVSSSFPVNIAVYVFAVLSGLVVMLGAGLLTAFAAGKIQGTPNYEPSKPVWYIIAFIGLVTGIASTIVILGFAADILS